MSKESNHSKECKFGSLSPPEHFFFSCQDFEKTSQCVAEKIKIVKRIQPQKWRKVWLFIAALIILSFLPTFWKDLAVRDRIINDCQTNPNISIIVSLSLYLLLDIYFFSCQDFEKTWQCAAELLTIFKGIQPQRGM